MSNFQEIENEMLRNKCLINVTNGNEFYSAIANCIQGSVYIKDIRVNAKIYVKSKSFILDKTVKTIQKYLV